MKLKAVFFDFDEVLSKDRFYTTLTKDYPQVYEYINNVIFSGDQQYSDRWMWGEFTYQQINHIIAKATDVPFNIINSSLIDSVQSFKLEKKLIEFAKKLTNAGIPVALVTNNMDIFNEVTVPIHHLNEIFSVIVNSADHGALKHEKHGILFDIALSQLGMESYEGIVLIDDSEKACDMFETKGGSVHRFKGVENFKYLFR